jgi:AMP phosphorylase
LKFSSKNLAIRAGSFYVAILHLDDAKRLDIWPTDRVELKKGKKTITAIIDVARDTAVVSPGTIGLYYETSQKLKARAADKIEVTPMATPQAVHYIKKKLEGEHLDYDKMKTIVSAISQNELTDTELTYFVSACYKNGLTIKEIEYLTRAMVETGDIIVPKKKPVFDKHCIGGIPGNRTTILVIPIVAAAGLCIPKTSSRAITSPAGTADTMEVMCNVTLPIEKTKKIIDKVGACIVWGGALNLAPADDTIIKVEHPMALDAEGNLIASILAKKLSVSSQIILIDIPVGKDAKITSMKKAKRLKAKFLAVGKLFKLKMKVVLTPGTEPIGNGVGPALEARDILRALTNHPKAPQDLIKKSVKMAGLLLEMGKKAKPGKGAEMALEILKSGKAYKKFVEIIKAQGEKVIDPDKVPVGKYIKLFRAEKSGIVVDIDNRKINPIARFLGAPVDKGAGIYIYKHEGNRVEKGNKLFKLFAESRRKLKDGIDFANKYYPYEIK